MQKKKNTLIKVKEHLDFLLIALVVIPLILFALHFFIPEELKEKLALHRDYIIGYEIFTNHFIHTDLKHLLENVISYLIAVVLLYVPLTFINEKRMFYILFILNLTILPIIISLIDIRISPLQYNKTLGFSGIVSSFLGMETYAWILFLNKNLGINTVFASISFILLIFFSLAFVYAQNNLLLIFFSLAVSLVFLILTFKSINKKAEKKLIRRARFPLIVELLKALIFVFYFIVFVFALAMFPYNPTGINIMAHYFGYLIGISTFFIFSLKNVKNQKNI